MLKYEQVKEKSERVSKIKEKLPNLWWKSQVLWNYITVKLAPSPSNGAIWFVFSQLVYLDFGPLMGVINKIYNLYHHALG